jgi:hypothetical protein
MNELTTDKPSFNLGTWLGRRQAFRLVASRCTVADIECVREIFENKLYRSMGMTCEQFCTECLGITRVWADTLIRRLKQLGPDFFKLNNFTRINPADYLRIADAVTGDGLAYGGEIIPLEAEHAAELAHAVEALRSERTPEPDTVDSSERAFTKAEKALQSALAAFERLQAMNLDEDGRLRLVLAVETGRDHLDRIRQTTTL